MLMVLVCFSLLKMARGFLLDPDHTANPAGKNECLPIGRYLSEKQNLLHHIDQLQRGNEEQLHILTTQLQTRLSAFEGNILINDRKNETLELVNIERKLQELGVNHTLLQQENKRLRDKYSYQESETKRLQNTTIELLKKVSDLEQLKSIHQALDFRAMQNKVQSLEHQSNLLTNNQYARNQDFLALYNVTQVIDTLFKKHRNESLDKFFNIESKQNAFSFEMQNSFSNITTLESQVADNSKKVAVTACVSSDQKFSDRVIRFSTVNFQVGINNINTFKSSGKFVCENPGLYYISAHIYTTTPYHAFYVRKNDGITIATSASGSGSAVTDPISAVIELQLNDMLYVDAGHYIRGPHSCVSILKVK